MLGTIIFSIYKPVTSSSCPKRSNLTLHSILIPGVSPIHVAEFFIQPPIWFRNFLFRPAFLDGFRIFPIEILHFYIMFPSFPIERFIVDFPRKTSIPIHDFPIFANEFLHLSYGIPSHSRPLLLQALLRQRLRPARLRPLLRFWAQDAARRMRRRTQPLRAACFERER